MAEDNAPCHCTQSIFDQLKSQVDVDKVLFVLMMASLTAGLVMFARLQRNLVRTAIETRRRIQLLQQVSEQQDLMHKAPVQRTDTLSTSTVCKCQRKGKTDTLL